MRKGEKWTTAQREKYERTLQKKAAEKEMAESQEMAHKFLGVANLEQELIRSGRTYSDALRKRSLTRRIKVSGQWVPIMYVIADQLINLAVEGNVAALKEFADRIEGKPMQGISNEGGVPFKIVVER